MPSFKKEERLCSKKLLEKLFSEGSHFLVYPLRISFLKTELTCTFPAQTVFSVSKKKFKKAHDRNLIKRRLRESFRIEKDIVYQYLTLNSLKIIISVSYIANDIQNYQSIHLATKKAIDKLLLTLNKNDKSFAIN
jgi:ribonuclease P protein component